MMVPVIIKAAANHKSKRLKVDVSQKRAMPITITASGLRMLPA
ncbi:MAG: hypothetical protein WA610_14045 [Thermodesulfovibrionales bacterium]